MLAASCAQATPDGAYGTEAFLANRDTRNPDSRCAADAAMRRKQDGEETFCSPTRPTRTRLVWSGLLPEAIERHATAALAWLARIPSPLLLKAASVFPQDLTLGGRLRDCLLE